MSSIERELNLYLFYEFGMNTGPGADESNVHESWPFQLRRVAQVGDDLVFEFEEDEPFFGLVADGLNFLPKAGMDVDALLLQIEGGRWLAARDPVSLDMSMPDDPSIPSGLERRAALHSLGSQALSSHLVETLVGLFLRAERRYLGLFRADGESNAVVVGLAETVSVPFPQASGWRRLAWGVGRWLEDEARREVAG